MSSVNSSKMIYPEGYSITLQTNSLQAKTEFHTHTSIHAERLHKASETLLLPARWNIQLLAHVIEPLPGKDKDHHLKGLVIRVASLVLLLLNLPLAALSTLVALPLRCIDHRYRPAVSFIDNSANVTGKSAEDLQLTKESPLHIRTHNLGLVTSGMSTLGDLRSPTERAKELVISITTVEQQPDVIFFQEVFHEDATKILCEGIKGTYPYIIHSVAPHISGFNSGSMVASKYPLNDVHFQTLHHMMGPERLSPRGITRVSIDTAEGPMALYGMHTQALIGEERAQARLKQLEEIETLMKNDQTKKQVLVGDFNTSRVTAWGEDNKDQAENMVMNQLNDSFTDLYLKDHDALTGQRTEGTSSYLETDNKRMKQENLPEPRGSWYHGPFADPGYLLSSKMRKDRKTHKRPEPGKVIEVKKATWGTPNWQSEQTANTARFDYVVIPNNSDLTGEAEIRRVKPGPQAQSAPSDHLPVDAKIWIKS